jgi:purine nucleosidase
VDRPLHVDTDCGVDDAFALVLLARAGVRIASVSSVFGNARSDQTASNANMVLRQSGVAADVFVGAPRALTGEPPDRNLRGHGFDGLNGQGGSFRRKLEPLRRPHGMSRLSFAPRGRIDGLFLGPLTNLALALPDDPSSFRNWRPVVMAGAFEVEGRGLGGADFNTWADPEAMERVLLNGLRPRLAPLDVTSKVAFDAERFLAAARADGWPLLERLARAAEPHVAFQTKAWGPGWRPHDVTAAAAWLWPDLFTFEPAALMLSSDSHGRLARTDGAANAEVAVAVDAEGVRQRVLRTLFEPAPYGFVNLDIVASLHRRPLRCWRNTCRTRFASSASIPALCAPAGAWWRSTARGCRTSPTASSPRPAIGRWRSASWSSSTRSARSSPSTRQMKRPWRKPS